MSYYAIKYFNDFFTGGGELGVHFITKVLEGIKRLSSYTEIPTRLPKVTFLTF